MAVVPPLPGLWPPAAPELPLVDVTQPSETRSTARIVGDKGDRSRIPYCIASRREQGL